jgi:hypothetical protein
MGFRNYEDFNQVLLAKQAWRLTTSPYSLCARVLRARYFKDGDFLTASCPKHASYTWKSILHGRELLKEGIIWRVGDGSKINIWNHNWIPRSSLKRPFGHRQDVEVDKVSELLEPSGAGWNLDKLNECFFEADVEDILKIPVGRTGSADYMAWNYTKNGVFSVRSAYHLKQHLKSMQAGRAGPSGSIDSHRGWLAIWSADVASKIKVHCWRLAKNGLAVGEELRRRKIKEGVCCIACNRDESLVHRFWSCPHSAHIWSLLRDKTGLLLEAPPGDFRSHNEFQVWLLEWFGNLQEKELGIAMLTIYQLWVSRNDARDLPMIEDPVMMPGIYQ